MIDRIALDLDDVLNEFTMWTLSQFVEGLDPYDFDAFPPEAGYDLIEAWSLMTGNAKVSVPMFWKWIGQDVWADAPKSQQFWVLEKARQLVGAENVLIATSPTKCRHCLAGKYDWMTRNLPDWAQRQYAITPRKWWLAQPGVLLIDDSDSNVNKFRELGGDAILMPRPWNTMHAQTNNSDQYLEEELGYRLYETPCTV